MFSILFMHFFIAYQPRITWRNSGAIDVNQRFFWLLNLVSIVPTPGDLAAQESPTPGICHPRQKKMLMPGGQPRGGGGAD